MHSSMSFNVFNFLLLNVWLYNKSTNNDPRNHGCDCSIENGTWQDFITQMNRKIVNLVPSRQSGKTIVKHLRTRKNFIKMCLLDLQHDTGWNSNGHGNGERTVFRHFPLKTVFNHSAKGSSSVMINPTSFRKLELILTFDLLT